MSHPSWYKIPASVAPGCSGLAQGDCKSRDPPCQWISEAATPHCKSRRGTATQSVNYEEIINYLLENPEMAEKVIRVARKNRPGKKPLYPESTGLSPTSKGRLAAARLAAAGAAAGPGAGLTARPLALPAPSRVAPRLATSPRAAGAAGLASVRPSLAAALAAGAAAPAGSLAGGAGATGRSSAYRFRAGDYDGDYDGYRVRAGDYDSYKRFAGDYDSYKANAGDYDGYRVRGYASPRRFY